MQAARRSLRNHLPSPPPPPRYLPPPHPLTAAPPLPLLYPPPKSPLNISSFHFPPLSPLSPLTLSFRSPLSCRSLPQRDVDGWRAFLGRYGISGKLQTTKISHLSEGQKSRIVFGILCMKNHNLLLLVSGVG